MRIGINGTKDLMTTWVPQVVAMMTNGWIEPKPGVKIQVPANTQMDVEATGNKLQLTFTPPLRIIVDRGAGPCEITLPGTIEVVKDITQQGAGLVLGDLPDQVLQWLP